MDELSKNVVPELVHDSPDPSELQTGDKKYYSTTQMDVWVTVTYKKDSSSKKRTDMRHVLFVFHENKIIF